MSETVVGTKQQADGGGGLLAGKTALITGSSRGIGHAIALEFARQGCSVVINSRSQEAADRVAAEIAATGVRTLAYGCNVADPAAAEKMVNDVVEQWKTIDILVNNAGITRDGLLMRMKEEDWDEIMAVNLKSAFNCTKPAVRAMMRQKKGTIINISSVVGLTGNPGQANYAASKAGLIGFTKAMAREVASRSITVNAIAPGYITTEMTANLPAEAAQKLMAGIPLARLGEPADVAHAAVFLASEGARYITGQVLVVDGGLTM